MIVFIDLDDTIADYSKAHRAQIERHPENPYPQSQYGFFASLEPIPGALESVWEIEVHGAYEVYILSAPSIHNPLCYTEKRVWVENRLGPHFVQRLILCCNKSLLRGDILIDNESDGRGQECFDGRFIHYGSTEYPDWESIKSALIL